MEILRRRLNPRKVIAENKVEEVKNEQKEKLNIESPKIKAFLAKIEKISPYTAILVEAFKINTNGEDLEFDEEKDEEKVAANSFAQKSGPDHYILPKIVLRKIRENGEDKTELSIYAGIFSTSRNCAVLGEPKVNTNLRTADLKSTATKDGIDCYLLEQEWLKSEPDYKSWLKNFKQGIEEKK